MSEAPLVELVVLCGTAVGLVMLGLAKATLGSRPWTVRLAASAGCALAAGALPAAFGFPPAAVVSVGLVLAVAVGSAVLGSPHAETIWHWVRGRNVRAGLLGAAGATLFIGSIARFEAADAAAVDADMAFMMEISWRPPTQEVTDVVATTDRGRPIRLHRPESPRGSAEVTSAERRAFGSLPQGEGVIRTGPAADEFNCHGWVFTGGRFWIGPDDVERILTDNGYQVVSQPRPGDVVIYRDSVQISHTGLVRTGGDGTPVVIESKWGWMGRYLHTPEGSVYGRSYTFYRSPRAGHVLTALASDPAGPDQRVAAAGGVRH